MNEFAALLPDQIQLRLAIFDAFLYFLKQNERTERPFKNTFQLVGGVHIGTFTKINLTLYTVT